MLKTPAAWNDFEVLAVTEREVVVAPEVSNKERSIDREVICRIFFDLVDTGKFYLEDAGTRYDSVNGSYILPLIDKHENVELRQDPARLLYHHKDESLGVNGELDPETAQFPQVDMNEEWAQLAFWTCERGIQDNDFA